jgi:hypothetical protein
MPADLELRPDGTLLCAGVPIAICSLFLLLLNIAETDDLHQICHRHSFRLHPVRGVSMPLALASGLGVVAIGSSVAQLTYYGYWVRSPRETWLSAAAVAATQLVFVAAFVFWVGRSHRAPLL